MAEVATDIKELGDKLAGLTLKQAVDLASYLKEAHGIEPAAGGVMMAGGGGGGGGGAAAEPKKPRPPSTSSSRPPATRRSRSSRSSAPPPAWASRKPRTWSKALPRPSRKTSTRKKPRSSRRNSKSRARPSSSSKLDAQLCEFIERRGGLDCRAARVSCVSDIALDSSWPRMHSSDKIIVCRNWHFQRTYSDVNENRPRPVGGGRSVLLFALIDRMLVRLIAVRSDSTLNDRGRPLSFGKAADFIDTCSRPELLGQATLQLAGIECG